MPVSPSFSTPIDDALSDAPERSIVFIQSQAEVLLGQMGQMAVASDARAMNLSAICVTVSLAVAGSTVLWSSGGNLIAASAGLAGLLFLAAVFFAMAGRVINFDVAGHEPKSLVRSAESDLWMAIYVIQELQKRIDDNRRVMKCSALLFNVAGVLALLSLPAAVLIYWSVGAFIHPF